MSYKVRRKPGKKLLPKPSFPSALSDLDSINDILYHIAEQGIYAMRFIGKVKLVDVQEDRATFPQREIAIIIYRGSAEGPLI